MSVGEVARAVGRSAETIRRLERQGVLPPAPRDRSGRRSYPETSVEEIARAIYPDLAREA
ncbi:MAG TPA: MerR family DNA-binding transcriptional regulator [Chloroflexota bacterium]|nr:MerR family DNA-binding transcriptional regulator [Chloroflexota bacterium]